MNPVDALHAVGLKATPQRLAVYEFLRETDTHPTAEEICQALRSRYPTLSLSTVYNTLDALVACGAINALGAVCGGRMHFDGNTAPHINLACSSCGRISDLPSELVEKLGEIVTRESGFSVTSSRIVFQGVCSDCRDNQPVVPTAS